MTPLIGNKSKGCKTKCGNNFPRFALTLFWNSNWQKNRTCTKVDVVLGLVVVVALCTLGIKDEIVEDRFVVYITIDGICVQERIITRFRGVPNG